MDNANAKRLAEELKGREIGGWKVAAYVGNGKSAVVLRAERGFETAAIKVFDPALVDHYGRARQLARIQREVSLVGKEHPNLVRILDGGECTATGYLFIAMEYLEWPDLEKVLVHVPRDNVRVLIAQIASAAKHLEGLGLAHRDIKPSNIAIRTDFQQAKLLDLGVLRPIANSDLTDNSGDRPFVGTLRYGPPEFLMREEEDTEPGWRAVTFYQLGAVLHDLIMLEQLFSQYGNPYLKLAEAIQTEPPHIESREVPNDLIVLAKNCLVKTPALRLRLVTWEDFDHSRRPPTGLQSAKARILSRQANSEAATAQPGSVEEENKRRQIQRRLSEIHNFLQTHVRHTCVTSGTFPPLTLRDIRGCPPECAQFAVAFPPSTKLDLPNSFTVFFRVTLLDVTSQAIQLEAALAIDRKEWTEWSVKDVQFSACFQAVVDAIKVGEVLDEIMYLSLDRAMTATPALHDGDPSAATAMWVSAVSLLQGTE